MPVWRWNWTVPSISRIRSRTRRDRRKDQVLQEDGYLVLRFLAEDVGKALDVVLDAILRSLSHRRASPSTVHTLTISRRNAT